jgi:heme/copper-type cytochrome/quinol oxidase subunit 2
MSRRAILTFAVILGLGAVQGALAAEPAMLKLVIRDHRFSPAEITVPANTPTVIQITNADPTPEEFDSPDLKVEKVIAGGQTGLVRLRPLKPGRYSFSGEYHAATAQGVVVSR